MSYLHPALADIDLPLLRRNSPGSSPLASTELAVVTAHIADATELPGAAR